MAAAFYLFKRKGVFYARFVNLTDGRTVDRSTGAINRDNAAAIVGKWLIEGVPTKDKAKKPLKNILDFNSLFNSIKNMSLNEVQIMELFKYWKAEGLINFNASSAIQGRQGFIQFLYDFYDYDNSLYYRDKRARGKNISLRHCKDANNKIKLYVNDYFKNKSIAEITRNDLREFGISLTESLAGKTINNIMQTITIPLRWAAREELIPKDITAGLGGYSGKKKKRGTLTDAEMEKLRDYKYWKNRTAYIAFLLSATSGLRSGEIRALRRQDIGEKLLHIRHSYNRIEKLKDTKNHEDRHSILLPSVKILLMELLEKNPTEVGADQFVFYSITNPTIPCGDNLLSKNLHIAINNAGIDVAGRNICFHSLRHYCGTVWANKTGDMRIVAKITGHKDLSMAAHYADHVHESEMAELSDKAANIIDFSGIAKGA